MLPEGFIEPTDFQQIGNGAYRARSGSDRNLSVKFYYNEEWDPIEKKHKKVEMLRIWKPGEKSWEYNTYPTLDHKKRFPVEYAAFLKGDSRVIGTPIDSWSYLQIKQLDDLKYLGIESVEQIAAMTEEQVNYLGPEGGELRAQAIFFVAEKEQNSTELRLQKALAERDAKISELEKKLNSVLVGPDGEPISAPKKKAGRPKKEVPQSFEEI